MTRLECDYRALKRPFVVLLITALAGTALLWSSNAWLSVHRNRLQQSRASLFDAREEYRQAVEAQTILKTAQQRYMQLEQRGFIGDEPRLLWIEALRDNGRRHHLYTLQYNLKQRQALQLTDEDSAHYQVYGSFMQLDIELAHEIDLLRYFTDLERERPAVWQLRGCTLSSMIEGGRIAFDKANVKASCELAWYTVKALSADNEGEEGL
jgi:hypothetical protein